MADQIFSPLLHVFLLILTAFIVSVVGRNPKWVLFTALIYSLVVIISPLARRLTLSLEYTHQVPKVLNQKDAAIVLGGQFVFYKKAQRQFTINESIERLIEAFRLHQQGLVRKIIITGASKYEGDPRLLPEADSMKKLLEEMGVSSKDILIERTARNTFENARNTLKVMKQNQIRQAYLVTSASHMPRAYATFQSQGVTGLTPYPVDFHLTPGQDHYLPTYYLLNLLLLRESLHELIGSIYYRWMGYIMPAKE